MSTPIEKVASNGGTEVVKLTHFTIGGHALRQEHVDFLRTSVVPVLDRGGSVLLMGMASRSGSAAANQAISERRTNEVLKKLRSLSKANFKVAQSVGVGETHAAQLGVKDGTEDGKFRAVQIVFWGKSEPPPPPTEEVKEGIDLKEVAEKLGLPEDELTRLLNQYNLPADIFINTVGIIGEFLPEAMATASALIGVTGLFAGMITQWVGFFAYLAQLDQQDELFFGTVGASFMMGDWAVSPKKLTDGAEFLPKWPDLWVKNHFAFAGSSKFPMFRKAWDDGARQMGKNFKELIDKQYTKYAFDAGLKGNKAHGPQDFEVLVKLAMLKQLNLTKFGPAAQGTGVTQYVYKILKPKVEERYRLKLHLKPEDLVYPSEEMNRK